MKRDGEKGNIFFYIFLGVALFGALSLAVSQGGRDSTKAATDDQNKMRASEIIDYSNTISRAVSTLRLRGTTLAALRFSDPSLSAANYGAPDSNNALNEVFDNEGGSAVYRAASADAITTTAEDYKFLSGNAVQGIGTTCAAASCSDLIMVLANLKLDVCNAINSALGIDSSGAPPVDSAIDTTDFFQGTMAYAQTIGDEAGSAALQQKQTGCFKNATDNAYYFYRVLWPQ